MPIEAVAKPVAAAPSAGEEPAKKIRPKEITIELNTPVQAHGETLNKMTFRRPTGGDLITIGDTYPIHMNFQTGEVRPNPPAMAEMMTILAAVPMSTIKSMDSEDFATCAYALMGFFPPGAQWWRF
jgi:hypothetical protein